MVERNRAPITARLVAATIASLSIFALNVFVSWAVRPTPGIRFYVEWYSVVAVIAFPFAIWLAHRISGRTVALLMMVGALLTIGSNWSPSPPEWAQWVLLFVHGAAFIGFCVAVSNVFLRLQEARVA